MLILRKYQLDIIFLFFAFLILLWTGLFLIKFYGADPHSYEWYVGGPLLILYTAYLWEIRNKIALADRRRHTAKSMVYWIALGIILFVSYSTPIPAGDFYTIDLLYILFTIFLADSYWDFKKVGWRDFRDKREMR